MPADPFAAIPEQHEAKRFLAATLQDGEAHAYLFHGPRGVGKRATALAYAGALLGDGARVERRSHPDLWVLEPLGEQVRIDDVQALRRDLHLRPFEAARRVYLIFDAHLLNADAADALLKSLEEPPAYAVVVLVADDLAALPETIRSRCQLVAFRRLSRGAVASALAALEPGLEAADAERIARLAGGRLDRAHELARPDRAAARAALLDLARSVYDDTAFDPQAAMRTLVRSATQRADEARAAAAASAPDSLTPREQEQRERRAARAAEREEIVESVLALAGWYRDLVVVAHGAEQAIENADRLDQLRADAALLGAARAEHGVEVALDVRRTFELQVQPTLALDALFVRLRRALHGLERASVG